MQKKIEILEDKLKDIQLSGGPVTFAPEMVDFDNEQWMQYFMDQLKSKTIRGTSIFALNIDAIKALEKANIEIRDLKDELKITRQQLEQKNDCPSSEEIMMELNNLQEKANSCQSDLNVLLRYSLKVLKCESTDVKSINEVKEIIQKYFPSETL
jgi:protein subunit release factor A